MNFHKKSLYWSNLCVSNCIFILISYANSRSYLLSPWISVHDVQWIRFKETISNKSAYSNNGQSKGSLNHGTIEKSTLDGLIRIVYRLGYKWIYLCMIWSYMTWTTLIKESPIIFFNKWHSKSITRWLQCEKGLNLEQWLDSNSHGYVIWFVCKNLLTSSCDPDTHMLVTWLCDIWKWCIATWNL